MWGNTSSKKKNLTWLCFQSLSCVTSKNSTRSLNQLQDVKDSRKKSPPCLWDAQSVPRIYCSTFNIKRKFYTTPNHFCNTLLLFESPRGCSCEFIFTSVSQFSFTVRFSKGYNWYKLFWGAKNLWHGIGAVNAKLCFYKYLLEFENRYWDISNFPCILK